MYKVICIWRGVWGPLKGPKKNLIFKYPETPFPGHFASQRKGRNGEQNASPPINFPIENLKFFPKSFPRRQGKDRIHLHSTPTTNFPLKTQNSSPNLPRGGEEMGNQIFPNNELPHWKLNILPQIFPKKGREGVWNKISISLSTNFPNENAKFFPRSSPGGRGGEEWVTKSFSTNELPHWELKILPQIFPKLRREGVGNRIHLIHSTAKRTSPLKTQNSSPKS